MPQIPPIEIVHLAYADFPTDPRVKREALAATETGRRVAVVALDRGGARPVQRYLGLTVIRVPGRKSRGGLFTYLLQYAAFVWRCQRLLARHPRLQHVKLVHVHTLPDFLVWAARPAQRRGAKLIFDMHEIFPEFVRSKVTGVTGRLASALARALERQARSRADVTIVVNRPIARLLETRPLKRPERSVLIHNSADPLDFGPPLLPTPRPPYRPLQLVYHGTLTALYGLDIAIRGVVEARAQGTDVQFSILGDGPQRPELVALVARLGAGGVVTFEPPLPPKDLPARLRLADAGLVPTRLDGMTRYSLSNKLLDYVHLGIPVLAARLPSYEEYLDERTAWFWNPGETADLARAIVAFARATPALRAERARAAQRALAPFAWPIERARLVSVYRELLGSSDGHASRIAAIRSAARPSP